MKVLVKTVVEIIYPDCPEDTRVYTVKSTDFTESVLAAIQDGCVDLNDTDEVIDWVLTVC